MAVRELTESELAQLSRSLITKANAKHLTEAELAERWGVSPQALAALRKAGNGPKCLEFAKSATKCTRRYRLVDVEEWEQENLVVPGAA